MLIKRISQLLSIKSIAPRWATASSNTNVTLTLSAISGKRHSAHGLQWSYSNNPTGGRITILSDSDVLLDHDIISGGPGGFAPSTPGNLGGTLVITLYAGGAGITGKLSCQTSTEDS